MLWQNKKGKITVLIELLDLIAQIYLSLITYRNSFAVLGVWIRICAEAAVCQNVKTLKVPQHT